MLKRMVTIAAREARANLNYHSVARQGSHDWAAKTDDAKTPAQVGIIRLDLIGDFVLFTGALSIYRAAFPEARLVLFGHAVWGGLAEWLNRSEIVSGTQPLFDEFVGVEPGRLAGLGYFREIAKKLAGMDVTVNAAFSRTNVVDKLIAAASRESVAMAGDTTNILAAQKRINDRLYTRLIPNSGAETEWERNLDFAQALAPGVAISRTPPVWMLERRLAKESVKALEASTGTPFADPFVVVSPFASLEIKQWPLARYSELIGRILEARGDYRVALLGGQDKTQEAESLVRMLPDASRVVNLVGKTSLVEATCLIRLATVSVSGDTAAGHLASAVGTPAVVVMGGGHYGRFFPYVAPLTMGGNWAVVHRMACFQCNWFCKYRRFSRRTPPCLEGVGVAEVLETVMGQIP